MISNILAASMSSLYSLLTPNKALFAFMYASTICSGVTTPALSASLVNSLLESLAPLTKSAVLYLKVLSGSTFTFLAPTKPHSSSPNSNCLPCGSKLSGSSLFFKDIFNLFNVG